jgi:hypothetical protein
MNRFFSSRLILLPKRGYQVVRVTALCTIVFALSAFFSAPSAQAASTVTTPTEQCQVVLDALQPDEPTSSVLSSHCVQGNQQLVAPQTSTLLMTLYKDKAYGGGSTRIYGNGPACDSSGYGIPNLSAWGSSWNDSVSSYKVWNNCNWSEIYSNINYGGVCEYNHGNVPWVGSLLNDQISSIRVASARVDASCDPGTYA